MKIAFSGHVKKIKMPSFYVNLIYASNNDTVYQHCLLIRSRTKFVIRISYKGDTPETQILSISDSVII